MNHHLSQPVSPCPQWKESGQRKWMSFVKKNFQRSLTGACENGRQWQWCVILTSAAYSWKADLFFKMEDSPLTALFFSPIAELPTKMNSVLPYSFQSVSLPLSPSNSHLSTLYSFPPPFLPLFRLSFSLSSLTFFHSFSNHCEIARRLVGDFSDREIWLRSESPVSIPAFLSQFKWFCSFTGTPTQTARHTHIDTLQVSRPLFLFCTRSLFHFSLFLCHTHTNKHIQNTIQT